MLQAPSGASGGRPPGSAAAAAAAAGRSLLEQLEGRALDGRGWQAALDPMLAPVRELLERSASPEEFLAGMADALGAMDDSELRRALASATFAARGLGDARDEP